MYGNWGALRCCPSGPVWLATQHGVFLLELLDALFCRSQPCQRGLVRLGQPVKLGAKVVGHRRHTLAGAFTSLRQLGTERIQPIHDFNPRRIFVDRVLQSSFLDICPAAQLGLGHAPVVERVDAMVLKDVDLDVAHCIAQPVKRSLGSRMGFLRICRGQSGCCCHDESLNG